MAALAAGAAVNKAELTGRMRDRVAFSRTTSDRDALGGVTGAVTDLGEYWAALESLDPGPATEAQARAARPRWQCVMRSAAAIRTGDLAHWNGRELRVLSVRVDHWPEALLTLQLEEL